ncbi:MAG TPA: glycosyltransferase family 2 protein [Candidatus Saccharimonadales bacterium]
MSAITPKKISFVVPLYNEATGVIEFHESLVAVVKESLDNYEIIYCDDGSADNTSELVAELSKNDKNIRLIKLSRNFGKENALTAGINFASGDAVFMIDGDGQHPVELIPDFIKAWLYGNKVVIGIRISNQDEGFIKKLGSRLFYKSFTLFTGREIVKGSTDFRIIDQAVVEAFLALKDTDRVTRGLIDWLGFKTSYIKFRAKAREHGNAGYSFNKLVKLAMNSYVGFSTTPLYFFGYLGVGITGISFITGIVVFIEQIILGDPLNWNFTGTAMLGILIIFLVGILLMAQGIMSVYISMIHNQAKQRPLYVIDFEASIGLNKNDRKT